MGLTISCVHVCTAVEGELWIYYFTIVMNNISVHKYDNVSIVCVWGGRWRTSKRITIILIGEASSTQVHNNYTCQTLWIVKSSADAAAAVKWVHGSHLNYYTTIVLHCLPNHHDKGEATTERIIKWTNKGKQCNLILALSGTFVRNNGSSLPL